jgi:hypothetical protein
MIEVPNSEIETDRQTDRRTYIHTYIHTYRQTDRQTDRQGTKAKEMEEEKIKSDIIILPGGEVCVFGVSLLSGASKCGRAKMSDQYNI